MKEVKKRKGRVLSILLTVCMLVGLLPADMLGGVLKVQATEDAGIATVSEGDASGSSEPYTLVVDELSTEKR